MENAKRFKKRRSESIYPLNLPEYQSFVETRQEEAKKYSGMFKSVINGGVKNLDVDVSSYTGNEVTEARNKNFIESVSKDAYIKETLNIVHDIIKQKKP